MNVNLYVTSKAPVIPFGAKEKSLEKVLSVCFQTKFESKQFIRSLDRFFGISSMELRVRTDSFRLARLLKEGMT